MSTQPRFVDTGPRLAAGVDDSLAQQELGQPVRHNLPMKEVCIKPGMVHHDLQPHPRRRVPDQNPPLAKAETATIRRKLIDTPARIATSARRITLHLSLQWPWQNAWTELFDRVSDPPPAITS